jgi:hypothetical protein
VRRFATMILTLCLSLSLTGVHYLLAQDEPKKDETSKPEASKPETPKPEAAKTEPAQEKEKEKEAAPKPDASASTEPPIPPAVEEKLEAARRAVAEAIVAAQDAGLVKTTIDPPPIFDILITGRANDESTLKAKTGVSPEVFGAWFTGYGTAKDFTAQKDVRITRPEAGLKELFSQRASILTRHIEAVRKAQGSAKKEEPSKKEDATEKPPAEKESKKEGSPTDDAKKDKGEEKAPKEDAQKNDNKGDGGQNKAPE